MLAPRFDVWKVPTENCPDIPVDWRGKEKRVIRTSAEIVHQNSSLPIESGYRWLQTSLAHGSHLVAVVQVGTYLRN